MIKVKVWNKIEFSESSAPSFQFECREAGLTGIGYVFRGVNGEGDDVTTTIHPAAVGKIVIDRTEEYITNLNEGEKDKLGDVVV